MKGVFLRKKFNTGLFVLFACGLLLIGLYIFIDIADPEATSKLLTLFIMGILAILVVIPSWFFNYGAFIHIDEDSIKAKYHWFGKIDCKLSDVTFALARVNTLIVQLNDGKTHTVMGVANSWPLASFLRRNMSFEVNEQPEALLKKMNELKSARKKRVFFVVVGLALMFINIFITVFLTGEKDPHEFGQIDWVVFAVMSVIEIATVIVTFCFAEKAGKSNVPIEKLRYAVQRRIIETKALLPGNMVKAFTDDNYSGRITVFGFPSDDSVYYTVEDFTSEYTLTNVYKSEIYECIDLLSGGLEALIDITNTVPH